MKCTHDQDCEQHMGDCALESVGRQVAAITVVTLFIVCVAMFTGAMFWRLCAPAQQTQIQAVTPHPCDHLYNVGRHRDWAACMGVGYVSD